MQQERSQLATQFSNNLLDATKAFKRLATRKEEVEGTPCLFICAVCPGAAASGAQGDADLPCSVCHLLKRDARTHMRSGVLCNSAVAGLQG